MSDELLDLEEYPPALPCGCDPETGRRCLECAEMTEAEVWEHWREQEAEDE